MTADTNASFNSNPPPLHEAPTLQNILDAITQLRTDTKAGFARVETRLSALETRISTLDHNNLARIYNASVKGPHDPLEVLRTPQNEDPPGFPVDFAQLSALPAAELDTLLAAYGLLRGGNLDARRKVFGLFIGVVSHA